MPVRTLCASVWSHADEHIIGLGVLDVAMSSRQQPSCMNERTGTGMPAAIFGVTNPDLSHERILGSNVLPADDCGRSVGSTRIPTLGKCQRQSSEQYED